MKLPFLNYSTHKRIFQKASFLFLVLILSNSCRLKNDELPKPDLQAPNYIEGQIVLGKQLENPFSVENMRKAMGNLQLNGRVNVRTTHLYLKFKPQNEEELTLLKQDTTLELFDYPLDYEIEEGGLFYHDPEVPNDQPTYQYVAVEIDHNLPPVDYEILDELYLPEEDESLSNGRASGISNEVIALEDEAFRITNNLPEPSNGANNNAKLSGSSWNPAGRIRVWDDVIGTHTTTTQIFDHWEYYPCDLGGLEPQLLKLPVEQCKRAVYRYETSTSVGSKIPISGVKVRANSWFKTRTALTDAQGYYYISFFRNPVNYSIKWERNDFDIRDGLYFQAYFTGPKKTGDWNVDLVSGKALRFATIHRAADRYFYKNTGGLKSAVNPFEKLKIGYLDNSGTGVNWGGTWLVFPTIQIHGKDGNSYWDTNELFSTTIHEIGHSTHVNLMGDVQFWQVDKQIKESWANAIEWYITDIEYTELGVVNYNNPNTNLFDDPIGNLADHMQWWDSSNLHDYTPLFIDLVDNFDRSGGPDDHITGYTMNTLELNVVKHSYGLTSLRSALKANKPNGVSDQDIEDYLAYYFDL